jgi:FAD/FMN-containing dehydrogenase
MQPTFESWGRYPRLRAEVRPLYWAHLPMQLPPPTSSMLPFGLGRSYGDSCLNGGNVLLATRGLNRFIAFDKEQGVIRYEAGVSFAEILDLIVLHSWFLPVTPGTKFVTVGGAIANDVHGKNHHLAGSFGNHLVQFELLRSDGQRLLCSPESNADLFHATIGGLGLTGLILWAEFRLKRIFGRQIRVETVKFLGL